MICYTQSWKYFNPCGKYWYFLTLDAEATEVRVDAWDSGKSRSFCTAEEMEGIYGRNDQWNGRKILRNS